MLHGTVTVYICSAVYTTVDEINGEVIVALSFILIKYFFSACTC